MDLLDELQEHGGSVVSRGLISAGPDPRTYLGFAQEDLAGADCPRVRINALSNAKRALHLQVETLTGALGYAQWESDGPQGFPRRLRFASQFGLVQPKILEKINGLRNDVEHEYIDPACSVVQDYVDVVTLYLDASDRLVRSFPYLRELHVGDWKEGRRYCLHAEAGSGVLDIYETGMDGVWELIRALEKEDGEQPCKAGSQLATKIKLRGQESRYFRGMRLLLGVRTS